MVKVKTESRKAIAIFFILIMLGSTLAFAILNAFSPQQKSFGIPNERILNYRLTDRQREILIPNGFTLIEYSYPSNCFECLEVKKSLEDATQNSDNQIFLQELTISENETSVLTITNILNQTIIENPTLDNAIKAVCGLLINTPLWCVTTQI